MVFVKKKPYTYKSLFKKCSECDFKITRDDGYSNYTVEGTSFNCALGVHPQAPFDRFYDKARELQFAEFCSSFKLGPGLEIDVEQEVLNSLTPHQKALLELEKTSMLIKQT